MVWWQLLQAAFLSWMVSGLSSTSLTYPSWVAIPLQSLGDLLPFNQSIIPICTVFEAQWWSVVSIVFYAELYIVALTLMLATSYQLLYRQGQNSQQWVSCVDDLSTAGQASQWHVPLDNYLCYSLVCKSLHYFLSTCSYLLRVTHSCTPAMQWCSTTSRSSLLLVREAGRI